MLKRTTVEPLNICTIFNGKETLKFKNPHEEEVSIAMYKVQLQLINFSQRSASCIVSLPTRRGTAGSNSAVEFVDVCIMYIHPTTACSSRHLPLQSSHILYITYDIYLEIKRQIG